MPRACACAEDCGGVAPAPCGGVVASLMAAGAGAVCGAYHLLHAQRHGLLGDQVGRAGGRERGRGG